MFNHNGSGNCVTYLKGYRDTCINNILKICSLGRQLDR